MSSIVTDVQTIQEMVDRAIEDSVSRILPRLVREAVRKPYLTREEVRDLTGWSDRTLQHLRDTRQIEFVQDGRKILYPTDALERFLDARIVRARQTPGREDRRS